MADKENDVYKEKRRADSARAVEAKNDPAGKDAFLAEEQVHILKLASVILKKGITMSDDEYSVALIATSEAIDTYDPEKNSDFWSYAALVIRNRLADLYRRESRSLEFSVSPHAFEGNTDADDPEFGISVEIKEKITVRSLGVNTALADEMKALGDELKAFGISFSDLVSCSPKSKKTKAGCADVIKLIFLPPPLYETVKRTGKLPAAEIRQRGKADKKLMERHRKYLIAATVILSGDYPRLAEYLKDLKPYVANIINFEERRIGS
ncbi:MAG: hypothetical protein K6F86_08815 [Lachnospiraceae bacterium]|nr:hypothetical protein [Lachnospiraceae bacterium]